MPKTLLLLFAGVFPCLAQLPFSVGLKAGVPLNDALSASPNGAASYLQNTNRYIVGPYAELRLPVGFAVEVDALYRSYDYTEISPASRSASTGAWEFPVLAKKSLLGGPLQPYVEGGIALSHLTLNNVVELNHSNNYGIVLGAGVSLHLGPLRIAPELRYNGWVFQGISSPLGGLNSNRNQAALLVGISF